MAEYLVEIEPQFDLDQIALQIRTEEAGYSEFLGNQVVLYNGRNTNLAKFKETTASLSSILLSTVAPPGKTPIWQGVMLVKNVTAIVFAIR